MLTEISENNLINRLAADFPRSPLQLNRIHEADAEILVVPGAAGTHLALTTDTLAEEIASGLYADPYLIGWMTATVNLSDLAAVGARPLGLLVAETIPAEASEEFLGEIQRGIGDACREAGTYVLGGDTNTGASLSMTGCAIGILDGGDALTRIGCAPGEILFASGSLGLGSAYAFARLSGTPPPPYQPRARLREGDLLRRHATCCMDSSDGLLATLDQLMRLNGAGFLLDPAWATCLAPEALALARRLEVPDWVAAAGEHGEFELIFTVPGGRLREFFDAARTIGWVPLQLGRVVPERQILVPGGDGTPRQVDTASIRNLAGLARRDVRAYLEALRAIARKQQASTPS